MSVTSDSGPRRIVAAPRQSGPLVCLVVALKVEARPLIERLELDSGTTQTAPFPIFRNEAVALLTSGVGRVASASAVGYAAGLLGLPRATGWLNVGIAGHRELDLGTPVLAHRVIEESSGRCSYPALVEPLGRALRDSIAPMSSPGTADVRTVDDVERQYVTPAIYEMEAAGFMASASRFSTAELVHVLKIVSDNRLSSPDLLDRRAIDEMVSARAETIAIIVDALSRRAEELRRLAAPPAALEVYVDRIRFSVTERRQLDEQLRRWRAFDPDSDLVLEQLGSLTRARQVLEGIQQRICELETKAF